MKNNIKNVRERCGMTQKESANKLGIKLRAWQTYEQGISEPKQEIMFKMADLYDVTLDELLGREPKQIAEAEFDVKKFKEEFSAAYKVYRKVDKEAKYRILETMIQIETDEKMKAQNDLSVK